MDPVLFDVNFCALDVSAGEAFKMASRRGRVLEAGKYLKRASTVNAESLSGPSLGGAGSLLDQTPWPFMSEMPGAV